MSLGKGLRLQKLSAIPSECSVLPLNQECEHSAVATPSSWIHQAFCHRTVSPNKTLPSVSCLNTVLSQQMTIKKILNIIQPLIKAYRKIKESLLDFKSVSGIIHSALNDTKLTLKRNSTSTRNAATTSAEYKFCRTSENSQQAKLL